MNRDDRESIAEWIERVASEQHSAPPIDLVEEDRARNLRDSLRTKGSTRWGPHKEKIKGIAALSLKFTMEERSEGSWITDVVQALDSAN